MTWLTPSLTLPMLPAPSVLVNCHSPRVLLLRAPCTTVCCGCWDAEEVVGGVERGPAAASPVPGAIRREPDREAGPSVIVPPALRPPFVEMLACLEGGRESVNGGRPEGEDRKLASLAKVELGVAPLEVDRGAAAPFGRLAEVATPAPALAPAAADTAR